MRRKCLKKSASDSTDSQKVHGAYHQSKFSSASKDAQAAGSSVLTTWPQLVLISAAQCTKGLLSESVQTRSCPRLQIELASRLLEILVYLATPSPGPGLERLELELVLQRSRLASVISAPPALLLAPPAPRVPPASAGRPTAQKDTRARTGASLPFMRRRRSISHIGDLVLLFG